jgi:adenosine deaminase CECR1
MTIHGWKQLAEWSIEHSCLDEGQIQEAKAIHAREWERFCEWIVRTFGAEVDGVGER